MRSRWIKIFCSLILAFGGLIILTRTIFYPKTPIIRPSVIFFPQVIKPILDFPAPSDYQPPDSPINQPGLIYPTERLYPTFNPDRFITIIPEDN